MERLRSIRVRGCHVHNLRGVDVDVPHGKLTVVTGVSGSGKSSLAFDTVFAEGRRRYLESLSAYARQFVEQVPRPDVDRIDGLPPTVSIDQRTTRGGVRATVASMAEVLEYLRLLWARVGTRHCERCGKPVTATTVDLIVARVQATARKRKRKSAMLFAPMVQRRKGFHKDVFDLMSRLGYATARVDGALVPTDPPPALPRFKEHSIEALVASPSVANAAMDELRAAVETALSRGGGTLFASFDPDAAEVEVFSSVAACSDCGIAYAPLDVGELSWSTKAGMCRTCDGTGVRESDDDASSRDARPCGSCEGARLSPAARAVKFRALGLHDLLRMPAGDARAWLLAQRAADAREAAVLEGVLGEVASRLDFLDRVGLAYLALDRAARTLSGGEAQRVRLASQLGTGLRGACYVLDEPTIGLHPADNARLLATMRALSDRGATLLVVEHDEDTIRAADHVIDVGPGAGRHGGRIVAHGSPAALAGERLGVTGPWLAGDLRVAPHRERRPWKGVPSIALRGATARNLRDVDVSFPCGALSVVTGVSGSGKSTLVRDVLGPALLRALGLAGPEPGAHRSIEGAALVQGVLEIDQSPIGKTSRSVPATYTGIMDPLRALFAESVDAKVRGFGAPRFTFNGKGGCPACKGSGRLTMEMSFLPDVAVPCDACGGRRYDEETLSVRFLGRTIAETLDLTIAEARPAFASFPQIAKVLDVLDEVGLGYLQLGQPSPTLSGGEAQRVKLATEMAKRGRGKIVYLLDEPTTGLHFADVEKLVRVLRGLTDLGNTVIVIEHHLDVMAAADYLVDLGPGGGAAGGRVVASGSPEEVAARAGRSESVTAACLAAKLGGAGAAHAGGPPVVAAPAAEEAARPRKRKPPPRPSAS
ncbi:MAG: UvrABC system protein A [Planctomycetes bacterium]|nr:UvrABC system protein A [Planctomycetota bacterium]